MASAGIGVDLEGVHAVAAALDAGRVRRLTVERSRRQRPEIAAIVERAVAQSVAVEFVDDVRPLASTEAPQGLVAAARPLPTVDLETAVAATDPAAIVVLDHLVDPRNVGAIARSAVAAGVRAMVVPVRRAAPLGATAFKSAAGAFEHLQVATVNSVADALSRLGKRGVWLLGLDGSAEDTLFGHGLLTEPVAIVIGAEGRGLGHLVRERLDAVARIPLAPEVESLNASVAAALAVFELARVRGWVT